jgi:hypothetical protein
LFFGSISSGAHELFHRRNFPVQWQLGFQMGHSWRYPSIKRNPSPKSANYFAAANEAYLTGICAVGHFGWRHLTARQQQREIVTYRIAPAVPPFGSTIFRERQHTGSTTCIAGAGFTGSLVEIKSFTGPLFRVIDDFRSRVHRQIHADGFFSCHIK